MVTAAVLKKARKLAGESSKMKEVVNEILKNAEALSELRPDQNFALKITNPGYMTLSIERHATRVTVTHYFESNGDLVPDPDMEFMILPSGNWIPAAIQHSNGVYQRAAEQNENGLQIYPRAFISQVEFANDWARNLISQNFHQAPIARYAILN